MVDLENEKQAPNKPPEVEANARCFIYLMDIRDTALFDKYIKKIDVPKTPAAEPELRTVEDLSPIEIGDSDNESSSDDSNDAVISLLDSDWYVHAKLVEVYQ